MKQRLAPLSAILISLINGGISSQAASTPYFTPLSVGEVRPQGWLKTQLEQDMISGYLPHLPELTDYVTLETFNAAAKESMYKPPIGAVWWSGEQTGCWLEGYIMTAYFSENTEAMQAVDQLVDQALSYQEADGYLGVYDRDSRFQQPIGLVNGELWAQTALFRGLLAYYELTGRQDVYDAVKKAVDLSISKYAGLKYWPNKIPRGGAPHSLMFVDICEWFYRTTGDSEYLDFAQELYDEYNNRNSVFEYDTLLKNLADEEKLFNGHGVHVLEHVRVPYFLYHATGDSKYDAVNNYPMKIERHLNAGGAVIGDEDILQRVAGPEIGCEFCTMHELQHSMQSVLQKTAQAFAGDWIERVAFNAAQGARMKDGRAIAYLSSDDQPEASVARGHGMRFKYSPTHEDVALCCVNWAGRMYPYYVHGMWMKTSDGTGLAATAYGPATLKTKLNGLNVTIEENTIYPFEDQIEFTVTPEQSLAFPIFFRNPGWSNDTKVFAAGAEITREDGFIKVEKNWQPGDRVILKFDAEIKQQQLQGGNTYFTRGPLTYALRIPEKTKTIRTYDNGFADYDLIPATGKATEYALPEGGTTFTLQKGSTDPNRPWEHCGLALTGSLQNRTSGEIETVKLVPEGTALLRQTTFALAAQIWDLSVPENLALLAQVEASSQSARHPASAVNDGVASGHPEDPGAEWSSQFETTGAKVRLTWNKPITIENVWLFDRPNANDHIQAAWVNFSNGSHIIAEGFDNEGVTPVLLNFPEKTVTWIEVIVTKTGPNTRNAGFSEIAVFKDEPESE